MRVITLNVNGIRSATSKGALEWLSRAEADAICLQEMKAQDADLSASMRSIGPLTGRFHFAQKKGYSGVGLYLQNSPEHTTVGVNAKEFDDEGRYIEASYKKLTLISLYLPSGSSGPERQASKFRFLEHFLPHLHRLRKSGREVILCGDWNIAHKEIDLKNWRSNQKNSGFLPEERAWLTKVIDELGFVDVFRQLDSRPEQYTWWSNRGQAHAKNVGWRIDYQIATPGIAATAARASIYTEQRFSDHAPLIIDYDFELA